MKLAPLFATTLLICSSCAPKATLVEEADQPTKPTTSEKPKEQPITEDLPNFRPNDGLLDPSGLATMPDDRDMKPTVGPLDPGQSTVIANPPDQKKPTSE